MDPDYGAALLRTLFTQSPIGLHVLDRDLRVVRYNTGARIGYQMDPEEVIGRTWMDLGLATEDLQRMMHGVLETGESVLDHVYLAPRPMGHHVGRTLSVSLFRLTEPSGHVLGIAATLVDITEREEARKRLETLYQAGERIGTTLDVARTCQELVEVAAGGFADVAAVDILDAVLSGDAPAPGPVTERVTVRRVAFATAPGRKIPIAHPMGSVRVLRYGTPFTQTLSDLQPRRGSLTPDDYWLGDDTVQPELVRASGAHSLIVLPLTARGVVLGVLTLYRAAGSPPFEDSDVTLASDLANRAALSVDNARRFTREHTLAQLTQRNLVPARLPEHTAVETAYTYLPVISSGVWYDVIALSGSRVALVAGGVSGRGMPAVTTMGRLRTVLGALATLDLPVEELLERLHELTGRLAREYPSRGDFPTELAATCLYVLYDPITRNCSLASAGHPLPVLMLPNGRAEVFDAPQGPVLGRGVPEYTTTQMVLPPDSILVLRNKGLVMDDQEEELRRYQEVLSQPGTGLWEKCDTLLASLLPQEPEDDAMLLLAKTRVLDPDRVASWTLPGGPRSVSEARRLVRERLAAWELDDLVFDTELIASELVTNAVRFTEGPVELRLIRDAALTCEVSDASRTTAQMRHAEEDDEGGRGLFLVNQLSHRWGMRATARGKTIWAEQPVP